MNVEANAEKEHPAAGAGLGRPRVVVSIVNWRAADLTIACLRSVAAEIAALPGCRVVLVDNCSGDGSAEKLEEAIHLNGWGEWLTFVKAEKNGGFASGNNIALRTALTSGHKPEYFLLLNPDTIVRPGAFELLLQFMDAHPNVGIAGGRSEDPDGTPQVCCFPFPNAVGELALYSRTGLLERVFRRSLTNFGIPERPMPVDWVSGAFMMIRSAVIDDIGLMDEGFFLYYEETDFTFRARAAGWSCWHVPSSRIVHLVGQSSGVTRRDLPPRRVPPYWFQSRRRYFMMNHGWLYACVTDLLVLVGFLSWKVRKALKPNVAGDPPHFLRDFVRHSAFLKPFGAAQERRVGL